MRVGIKKRGEGLKGGWRWKVGHEQKIRQWTEKKSQVKYEGEMKQEEVENITEGKKEEGKKGGGRWRKVNANENRNEGMGDG